MKLFGRFGYKIVKPAQYKVRRERDQRTTESVAPTDRRSGRGAAIPSGNGSPRQLCHLLGRGAQKHRPGESTWGATSCGSRWSGSGSDRPLIEVERIGIGQTAPTDRADRLLKWSGSGSHSPAWKPGNSTGGKI